MPVEYLRGIAEESFPLSVMAESSIDKLRLLSAAGMVTVELPEPGVEGTATVHAVTGLGRATLKVRSPSPSSGKPPRP